MKNIRRVAQVTQPAKRSGPTVSSLGSNFGTVRRDQESSADEGNEKRDVSVSITPWSDRGHCSSQCTPMRIEALSESRRLHRVLRAA